MKHRTRTGADDRAARLERRLARLELHMYSGWLPFDDLRLGTDTQSRIRIWRAGSYPFLGNEVTTVLQLDHRGLSVSYDGGASLWPLSGEVLWRDELSLSGALTGTSFTVVHPSTGERIPIRDGLLVLSGIVRTRGSTASGIDSWWAIGADGSTLTTFEAPSLYGATTSAHFYLALARRGQLA